MALPDVREWSGGPPRCPGVVGRSSRKIGSSREVLQEVRDWSEGPPGCPGLVGMPTRISGSGRKADPNVREWSGGPLLLYRSKVMTVYHARALEYTYEYTCE